MREIPNFSESTLASLATAQNVFLHKTLTEPDQRGFFPPSKIRLDTNQRRIHTRPFRVTVNVDRALPFR